jgi:hypothetical protein
MRAPACPKVNLQIRASNEHAVAFYRHLGYDIDDAGSRWRVGAGSGAGRRRGVRRCRRGGRDPPRRLQRPRPGRPGWVRVAAELLTDTGRRPEDECTLPLDCLAATASTGDSSTALAQPEVIDSEDLLEGLRAALKWTPELRTLIKSWKAELKATPAHLPSRVP